MKAVSGYIGSGLVHLLVVAALCAGAFWTRELMTPERESIAPPGPGGVITLDPGPGGSGPAGAPTPAPAVRRLPVVQPIDAGAMIRDLENARRVEAANNARIVPVKAKPAPGRPVVTASRSDVSVAAGPAGARSIRGASVGSPGATAVPGTPAAGSPGAGVPDGGISESGEFARTVRDRFLAVHAPLFESRGGAIAGDRDSCVVRIVVSASGDIAFHSWKVAPADPAMDGIVRQTIAGMGRLKPPSGREETMVFRVSGAVAE